MSFVTQGFPGSDWHSGWYFIPANTAIKIVLFKQSVTFGPLGLDGSLLVEGQFILEP